MRTPKALFYASIATLVAPASTFAMGFGSSNVTDSLKGTTASADSAVQTIIGNATKFLYLLAVVYGLWGGYKILTAGADSKKVDEGKTMITNTVFGLIVIFLASSIIQWVIGSLLGQSS